MIPVTPGYEPRVPCPQCNYMHDLTDDVRIDRRVWVTKQHATDRYTWKTMINEDWSNGDIVCDSDGDMWMFWDDYWVDPAGYGRDSRSMKTCEMEDWAEEQLAQDYMETSLPNYEPFAVYHRMPRLNRPVFASLAEAEAWLDENGR